MIRQLASVLACFVGVLLSFVGWYQLEPVQSWLATRDFEPLQFIGGLAAWAIAGAISCLFLSRHIACWAMKVDILPLESSDVDVKRAEQIFARVSLAQGWKTSPQLGIYERPEVNCFVAGWSIKHGVLCLSRGALSKTSQDELEALILRGLIQLRSGDLICISMMQGLVYSFSLYVARMLALLLGTSLRATEEETTSSDTVELFVTGVLMLCLTLPGALIFWAFSRSSALRADRAAQKILGSASYKKLLEQDGSDPLLYRELFSDSSKWICRVYPKYLTLASPLPPTSKRLQQFSA